MADRKTKDSIKNRYGQNSIGTRDKFQRAIDEEDSATTASERRKSVTKMLDDSNAQQRGKDIEADRRDGESGEPGRGKSKMVKSANEGERNTEEWQGEDGEVLVERQETPRPKMSKADKRYAKKAVSKDSED